MQSNAVIIIPTIIFFLYLQPFDFNMNPKTIDAIGIGVIKKYSHIFSKKLFSSEIAPTKVNAANIESNDAINSTTEADLHLSGMGFSANFVGFLYIYE